MSFSAVSRYSNALSLSFTPPGGRPALEGTGTFQPTTLERLAMSRASADDQFEAAFIEQFRGAMQNRLNFLTSQLQQAYSAMLQSATSAMIKGGSTNSYVDQYNNGNEAFAGIGDATGDFDGDGLKDIGTQGVTAYQNGSISGASSVNFRSFGTNGAAIDLKQKMKITMRSEESGSPISPLDTLSPGFAHRVKEYETDVSTGGFWTGVNYLYAWRPSSLQYEYLDGYSQNSDSAGFDGYLSLAQKTSGNNSSSHYDQNPASGDRGDGTMFNQFRGMPKWQGNGFGDGYLATENTKLGDENKGATDIGLDADTSNDDEHYANTYYVRKRTATVTNTVTAPSVDLSAYLNGTAASGTISQGMTAIENVNEHGFLGATGKSWDRLNGNMYVDPAGTGSEHLPGTGKIEEKFTGRWAESRYGITDYEGQNVAGNGANPMFGNFELSRMNAFYHPDETLTVSRTDATLGTVSVYQNGVNMDPAEADKDKRLGQIRKFMSAGNSTTDVDPRRNSVNSLQEMILDILSKPKYRDILRLGLLKDVVINGGANSPAGGVVSGTIRLSYIQKPIWDADGDGDVDAADFAAYDMSDRAKGLKPGISAQMLIFQDKFVAKGS